MPRKNAWNYGLKGLGRKRLKQIITVARLVGAVLAFQLFLSSNLLAQFDGRPLGHSYIINAPLPSRSITLFQYIDEKGDFPVGKIPVAQLTDDTEVDKFQSTLDGWAYVRVVETGQEGWAREIVDGVRHITCCRPQGVDSANLPPPGTFDHEGPSSYEIGSRKLLVKRITNTEFLFTMLDGVEGTDVQCRSTMVNCVKIDGIAKRQGSTYVFRGPAQSDGTIALQIVDEDVILLSASNNFRIDGSTRSLIAANGRYRRDRGVGVEMDYVGFKTPSGDIICKFGADPEYLECQIRGHTMSFPNTDCSNPGFDDGYPGDVFRIEVDSKRGRPGCLTDQLYFLQMFNNVPYLQYGDTWRESDFTCRSDKEGLTCSNSSGHGFFLSEARQTVF